MHLVFGNNKNKCHLSYEAFFWWLCFYHFLSFFQILPLLFPSFGFAAFLYTNCSFSAFITTPSLSLEFLPVMYHVYFPTLSFLMPSHCSMLMFFHFHIGLSLDTQQQAEVILRCRSPTLLITLNSNSSLRKSNCPAYLCLMFMICDVTDLLSLVTICCLFHRALNVLFLTITEIRAIKDLEEDRLMSLRRKRQISSGIQIWHIHSSPRSNFFFFFKLGKKSVYKHSDV